MRADRSVLFCNGLPIQKQSFEAELNRPKKDFVQHFVKHRTKNQSPYDWDAYYKHLVLPYQTLKKFYQFGFSFEDECSFASFQQHVLSAETKVIIFFSHCIYNGQPGECIEFFDRMVSSEEIFQLLPRDVVKVYDFAVCNSIYLRDQTSRIKRAYVFGSSSRFIPLSVWIQLYADTFLNMVTKKFDYVEAFDETIKQIEERRKKKLK